MLLASHSPLTIRSREHLKCGEDYSKEQPTCHRTGLCRVAGPLFAPCMKPSVLNLGKALDIVYCVYVLLPNQTALMPNQDISPGPNY